MADKTIYFETREKLKQKDNMFKSRAAISEHLGIREDRLGDIETGVVTPKADEVVAMAKIYNAPELYNHYCAHECEIGKQYVPKIESENLDLFKITLQFYNAIHEVDELERKLLFIADDGAVTEDEYESFQEILDSLDSLAARTTALKLWAHKNFNP